MFKINNAEMYYPNDFIMAKQDNIVSQITTLSGRVIGDIRGWRYADTVFHWGVLTNQEVQMLAGLNQFTVTFDDIDGTVKTINAIRTTIVGQKMCRYRDGVVEFLDVEMGVMFPDVYE